MNRFPLAPLRHALLYAACLALSVGLFFKMQLSSSFANLFGDRLDGGIQTALLEHWRNVLAGAETWNGPLYFFPHRDTIGFNDGYLLYGPPYALFRAVGADPFLATELVDMVLRAAAFAAMQLLLRRSLRLGRGVSLLGAVVFATSCNAQMQANHSQLLSAGFAPFYAFLLWTAATAFGAGAYRRAAWWAAGAAAFMGAWLLTAYYMAWFSLFLTAVFAGLALLSRPVAARRWLAGLPRPAWRAVAWVAAAGVLAVAPFLVAYLPSAAATGMHNFGAPRYYSTSVFDLTHVGDGNPLLSSLDAAVQGRFRPDLPRLDEHTVGLTPLLLGLFALACVRLWRGRAAPGVRPLLLLAAASVIVWAFTLRIGGAAMWYSVFRLAPGAKALRVIVRYQLLMTAPVVAVAAWYLDGLRRRVPAIAVAALGVWLVAEQVTFGPVLGLDRRAEVARLGAVPPPPEGCRSFFVSRGRPTPTHDPVIDGLYSPNVDAMLVAERFRLPTLAGFATFTPSDWVFEDVSRPDTLARVQAYAAAHGLTGVCGLDLTAMRWDPAPFG